ncbi:MAG: EAL domain-containing protein [Sorangiineae bacterium]|nr:EAL domain-containing protein [Polyangiaceae bacterium]MEB2323180.1 EAL domain-containing protein [Sorangiineae bacterium]
MPTDVASPSMLAAGAAREVNGLDDDSGTFSAPPSVGTVLLVDDDEAFLRALERHLKLAGFAPKTASCGADAIALLASEQFDVVVSDIAMPGMSGIEFLRRLRDIDLVVPVVILTGEPTVDTAAHAVEYGAYRYLSKPVAIEAFSAVLEQAVRFHRMARMKARAAALLGTESAGPGDRVGLEVSFERALETLWMAYQPIVEPRRHVVYGFEALMRSNEPSLPHPGAVLDAASRLARLEELGRSVRARAANPMLESAAAGALFVNLHVRDLLDPTLTSDASPLSRLADRVVLEITERAALDEVGDVRPRIRRLREMGFRIAIDDLGAGYSGLTSFAQLEPEVVKLDMTLVRGIDSSATLRKVVRSMTSLCHDMNILVVAEGVETTAERDTLVELGCDLLQGYLFAKPERPFPDVRW